jgi:hypothetical protein
MGVEGGREVNLETVIGVVFLALGFIAVYRAGYYRGKQHEIERHVAELQRKYQYSDYRAIDDKMNTSHYVDVLKQWTERGDDE